MKSTSPTVQHKTHLLTEAPPIIYGVEEEVSAIVNRGVKEDSVKFGSGEFGVNKLVFRCTDVIRWERDILRECVRIQEIKTELPKERSFAIAMSLRSTCCERLYDLESDWPMHFLLLRLEDHPGYQGIDLGKPTKADSP